MQIIRFFALLPFLLSIGGQIDLPRTAPSREAQMPPNAQTSQSAQIPQEAQTSQDAQIPQTAQTPLRGIYLTSTTVSSPKGRALIDKFAAVGGNMIVFDVQAGGGRLAYPSNLPASIEIGSRGNEIPDLLALTNELHAKGFYAVARFVLFKNWFLAGKKPQWTLKKKNGRGVFANRDGPVWLDPSNDELKTYLADVAREIAMSGVDEIQFDYIRFPEGGRGGYIGYSWNGAGRMTQEQAISDFVALAAREIHAFNVNVAVDVFGIVVWDTVSGRIIGQNVGELAKHADVIYPMPYPSHFGPGWGGHRNPADEPYFFVQETTKKFMEQAAAVPRRGEEAQENETSAPARRAIGDAVKIRPWLQGFAMRTSHYGAGYIREQIRALTDIGINEFSIWNAANNYGVALEALKNP